MGLSQYGNIADEFAKTPDCFIQRLKNADTRIHSLQSMINKSFYNASVNNRMNSKKERSVVFVTGRTTTRAAKLAYGLKKNGWNVILLHADPINLESYNSFSATYQYQNEFDLMINALRHNPIVYHVFSNWNFQAAKLLISFRPGNIIFDNYDCLAGMLNPGVVSNEILAEERFCFENADGICCRSLETQYLKKTLEFNFKGKRLLIPDCCWNDSREQKNPIKKFGEGFHVALVYNIDGPDNSEKSNKYDLLTLARSFINSKIHLHVFPSTPGTYRNPACKPYAELADGENYFHFYDTLPYESLREKLRQCSAGLIDDKLFMYNSMKVNTKQRGFYAVGNKLFDYLDEGLPIIINSSPSLERIAIRNGCAVKFYNRELIDDIGGFIRNVNWTLLAKNAVLASKKYSIETHAVRLIAFYESVGGL